jgi:hypothetical protein
LCTHDKQSQSHGQLNLPQIHGNGNENENENDNEFLGLFGELTQSHIQEEPTQIKISNQVFFSSKNNTMLPKTTMTNPENRVNCVANHCC